MDKEIRNRIQRATQEARRLLETEYSEQLAGSYDILQDGRILAEPGGHLDANGRLVREKLVAVIEHKRAGGMKPTEAVADYLREAAFTTLNRFVALKMLEARGLVLESITRGDQSSGFKEFIGLAPALAMLEDHGYQLYIESLFDEIGREVGVLFDRRDPASLLWPRRQALQDLLALLNSDGLVEIWGEDETIGWVYQYFNSDDERRKMRDESAAPRNSRELAVRNQFFTPRYVVQFLTDNTLGRTWYEMQQGNTRLKETCQYLVRRPNEVFLSQGQEVPATEEEHADLTKEEILRLPAYIPYRQPKDPRDIKILDPACGSGHFLLYAFDLLQIIYEEAWAVEYDASKSEATGKTLREDYADLPSLHAAIPGLILRHNLHGIDIDPRCAQIAALALWIRAQRAYQDVNIARTARPPITRTNIIIAEPMPGEKEMLQEFANSLQPRVLGQMVEMIFDRMKLAGEAGSLLRIEDEITDVIEKAKSELRKQRSAPVASALPGLESFSKPQQSQFDFTDMPGMGFWEDAERHIVDALDAFSQRNGDGGMYKRHLFADDAARGFAFIDICRQRYDVILMNPPFGQASPMLGKLLSVGQLAGVTDLGMCMVEVATQRIVADGLIGALTSRTYLAIPTAKAWRDKVLLGPHQLLVLADLGYGVLDSAMVEAASYVIGQGGRLTKAAFIGALENTEKESVVNEAITSIIRGSTHPTCTFHHMTEFLGLKAHTICYWIPTVLLQSLSHLPTLSDTLGKVQTGLNTGDDFRFLRLAWEVLPNSIGKRDQVWAFCCKGGEYEPFYDDVDILLHWKAVSGEMREVPGARILNTELCFRTGIVYPMRTTSDISPRPLAPNCAFNKGAQYISVRNQEAASAALAIFYTRPFKLLVEAAYGGGDVSVAGSAARNYTGGVLNDIPFPSLSQQSESSIANMYREAATKIIRTLMHVETSRHFIIPALLRDASSIHELGIYRLHTRLQLLIEVGEISANIDAQVVRLLDWAGESEASLKSLWGEHPYRYPMNVTKGLEDELACSIQKAVKLFGIGNWSTDDTVDGSKRILTKKSFFSDRLLETLSHTLRLHPTSIIAYLLQNTDFLQLNIKHLCEDLVAYSLGIAFGRWDIRYATGEHSVLESPSPFDPIPVCPPGMLKNAAGLPAEHGDVPANYPIRITWSGILVDDPGHDDDIENRLEAVLSVLWPTQSEAIIQEACALLGVDSLRGFARVGLLTDHIKRYSKSRRKAPVYWQLATPSSSYSIWLYNHRLTKDTFYRVYADFVKPKLDYEERLLTQKRQEYGPDTTAGQRKEIMEQESFVEELRAFRDEVARVAPLWNPDLNDGVIINFAPLWRLVPQHRAWQKECKDCWEKLVAGDYDWAHLAMHLWPERVVPKCQKDRSLAIAHGLEETLWEQDEKGKWQPRDISRTQVDALITERSSEAVKAALHNLLTAPMPGGQEKRRRKK